MHRGKIVPDDAVLRGDDPGDAASRPTGGRRAAAEGGGRRNASRVRPEGLADPGDRQSFRDAFGKCLRRRLKEPPAHGAGGDAPLRCAACGVPSDERSDARHAQPRVSRVLEGATSQAARQAACEGSDVPFVASADESRRTER